MAKMKSQKDGMDSEDMGDESYSMSETAPKPELEDKGESVDKLPQGETSASRGDTSCAGSMTQGPVGDQEMGSDKAKGYAGFVDREVPRFRDNRKMGS